jgi:hypothetical protein
LLLSHLFLLFSRFLHLHKCKKVKCESTDAKGLSVEITRLDNTRKAARPLSNSSSGQLCERFRSWNSRNGNSSLWLMAVQQRSWFAHSGKTKRRRAVLEIFSALAFCRDHCAQTSLDTERKKAGGGFNTLIHGKSTHIDGWSVTRDKGG